MSQPADLSATALSAAFQAGTLSPVEALSSVLERIETHNEAVNAFVLLVPEEAMTSARAAEERWARGEPLSPLDGVPVSVKDLLLMAGHPTWRGSWLGSSAAPWTEDSPAVARLREAGTVIFGKTTTPEFGWKGVTDSPRTGITRNPWDTALTTGGSSGGSAAAVALGLGPISIGTDGGGSVRIPASFTGGFALKPTYGRVPTFPATAFGNLSHIGPMTRTVADAALLLDAIARPDHRDWSELPGSAGSFLTGLEQGLDGLRIAFSPDLGFVQVNPDVAAVVAGAVETLSGLARVELVDAGFDDPLTAFETLWFSGAAGAMRAVAGEGTADLCDPGFAETADQGLRLTALDYVRATSVRADLGRRMGELHQTYDVLVTPTMPITAFEAGHDVPPGSGLSRWTQWSPFTYPFNLTQQPAASVYCGRTLAGLPVGLQIVGPRFGEALVLRVARACELALGTPDWSSLPSQLGRHGAHRGDSQ